MRLIIEEWNLGFEITLICNFQVKGNFRKAQKALSVLIIHIAYTFLLNLLIKFSLNPLLNHKRRVFFYKLDIIILSYIIKTTKWEVTCMVRAFRMNMHNFEEIFTSLFTLFRGNWKLSKLRVKSALKFLNFIRMKF